MEYRIGIDVGGTFTDLALYEGRNGKLLLGKTLTTPHDPSEGVLIGFDELLAEAGISPADLVEVSHATTMATNTVIQRKGQPTALLTTRGFRDVLIIGRQKRWELYDNSVDKRRPIIDRRFIWEAPERVLHDGSVMTPLDESAVARAGTEMAAAGIRSAAICFLHSYKNADHERRAEEILNSVAPQIMVSRSSEVSPIYREYERTVTTLLNGYVMPGMATYIRRLESGLVERGYRRKVYIMQSNGGLATPSVAKRFPIRMLESGPAAGVLAVAKYARKLDTPNLLSFDMGGTTAKVCLIEDGRPALTGQFEFDMLGMKKNSGVPISIPAIDLVEIGSGGGSIARVEMGAIAVGPESASSVPGPICYGRGGTQPTVTDADLVLGYLNPSYFLGGKMSLDVRAAKRGIQAAIGEPLGLDVAQAAWGIHEVVTAQMAQAARGVSIGKGKDPRDFVLVPFGGAGPVHGVRLARMLGATKAMFPVGAGVASAIGLLMADPAFDLARTSVLPVNASTLPDINAIFAEMEAQAEGQLKASEIRGAFRLVRTCDMRFVGQGYEINVPLPGGMYGEADLARLHQAFFDAYAATYGDRAFDRGDPIAGVHWRLNAIIERPAFQFPEIRGEASSSSLKGHRRVFYPETKGYVDCPVHDRYSLQPGDVVMGPAIIEERESTIVLIPGSSASPDETGNLIVTLEPQGVQA